MQKVMCAVYDLLTQGGTTRLRFNWNVEVLQLHSGKIYRNNWYYIIIEYHGKCFRLE